MIGPLSYVGGKRRIAARLVSLIPPHTTYIEPFAGGAQLFFQKPPSKVEVLNDLDGELVNFLRICQRHPAELTRILRWQPASRRLFASYLEQPLGSLTDIERAARFFYLQKNAWGGLRTRQHFHYAISKRSNYAPTTLPKRLADAATRLDQVQIECLPYQDIFRRYDREATFFYIDPPYVGVNVYQYNFADDQFAELAERLRSLKGRFLLSLNDCPKARAWFAGFDRMEIAFTYTAVRRPTQFPELLFANYPLPTTLPAPLTPTPR